MTESRFRTVCSPDDFYAGDMTVPQADVVTLGQAITHLPWAGCNAGDELVQN